MKYAITTLGCKVNQYETQAIETLLQERGHTPADVDADVVIVNSCAVTAESARKSRQALRHAMAGNPSALSVICGCWSQLEPEVAQELGADIVGGSGDRVKLVSDIEAVLADRRKLVRVDDPFKRRKIEPLPAGAFSDHARAYLKVQDGCDNFCSYCIIPYARGRVRSMPPEDAARAAAELQTQGYRELVVTGIEVASYGKDLGGIGLADCLEAIAAAAPDVRLHLGSLEPTVITDDFCRRISALNICRHLHLSLQSGCDRTLSAMRRKYDTAFFGEAVDRLRKCFPGCGLTADLITGFPGETEEDHTATLAFIRRCGFSAMHVFPYSERPGTRAAEMAGQIPRAVRERRASEVREAAAAMSAQYLQGCVGQTLPVLFERDFQGMSTGHADNYVEVSVPDGALRGLVKIVEITGVSGEMLVGKVI